MRRLPWTSISKVLTPSVISASGRTKLERLLVPAVVAPGEGIAAVSLRGSFACDRRVDVLLGDLPLIPVAHRGPGGRDDDFLGRERLDLPVGAVSGFTAERERSRSTRPDR